MIYKLNNESITIGIECKNYVLLGSGAEQSQFFKNGKIMGKLLKYFEIPYRSNKDDTDGKGYSFNNGCSTCSFSQDDEIC